MTPDPIVEGIKRIREQIAARFDYDLEAILRDAQRRQEDGDHPVVRRPPRRLNEEVVAGSG